MAHRLGEAAGVVVMAVAVVRRNQRAAVRFG
jgi:hypothetical protein